MTQGASDAHCDYPRTFSAELIRHCEDGCIPPEVFADAQALLDDEHRRRYVRINPRCEERVLSAGAEALLRLQTHSQAALIGAGTFPTPEEDVASTPQPALFTGATTTMTPSVDEAITYQSGKSFVSGAAPRADALRIGLAALTGLPLASVEPVAWLPCGVFGLPWSYAMGGNTLFLDGTLLAMDAASIAAVVALHPRKGERVLDLCCAPGMKLGLLADAVSKGPTGGSGSPLSEESPSVTDGLVVGVDVSLSRLYMTRSTLKKQQQQLKRQEHDTINHSSALPVCLFAGDGCRFSMGSAAAALDLTGSSVDVSAGLTTMEKRRLQRQNLVTATTSGWKRGHLASGAAGPAGSNEVKSSPPPSVVYASPRTRAIVADWLREKGCDSTAAPSVTTPSLLSESLLFDRVLVDAECSHDGSVAHMQLGERHANSPNGRLDSAPDARAASLTALAIQKGRGVHNEYRMRHINLGIEEGVAASLRENAPSPSSPRTAGSHTGSGESSMNDAFTPSSASLFALQSGLLDNGYRQLRPGGTLVYATCSYSFLQNEYVVGRFLERANAATEVVGRCDACCSSTFNDVPGRTTAVLVPALSFAHEEGQESMSRVTGDDSVAACVRMDSEVQRRDVQQLLDAHVFDYGTVQRGRDRYGCVEGAGYGVPEAVESAALGSRFWPRIFRSSFLYVAKIWKRPPEVAVSVKNGGVVSGE
ncbi:hypothetical protein CUR178_04258 [Leishmania enriettii]|uniref:SAM-dependent methyltransferase RsmB-F/NOP2-type catalytic core domain-containing protein n=1 Tax=Leishmania enriettii TaxID=5663 RepID=A0A836HAL4_LEIEN|nr:hypothetical protein CUR178_04258 [Leishmania enriettii]